MATTNPDKAWVVQQARNVSLFFGEQLVLPRYLLRDHDSKYVREFDALFESDGVEVVPISVRAANMNAFLAFYTSLAQPGATTSPRGRSDSF